MSIGHLSEHGNYRLLDTLSVQDGGCGSSGFGFAAFVTNERNKCNISLYRFVFAFYFP